MLSWSSIGGALDEVVWYSCDAVARGLERCDIFGSFGDVEKVASFEVEDFSSLVREAAKSTLCR